MILVLFIFVNKHRYTLYRIGSHFQPGCVVRRIQNWHFLIFSFLNVAYIGYFLANSAMEGRGVVFWRQLMFEQTSYSETRFWSSFESSCAYTLFPGFSCPPAVFLNYWPGCHFFRQNNVQNVDYKTWNIYVCMILYI